jgi:hypothetical protein
MLLDVAPLHHLLATLASYATWPLRPQSQSASSAFPPPRCHIEHQPQRPSLHLDITPATPPSPSSSSSTSDDDDDVSSSSTPTPTPSIPSSPAFKFAQFDVDHRTGFAPNGTDELTRLPSVYDLWEDHLASATSSLSLGEDTSPAALARRASGTRWRSDFLSVSLHSPHLTPPLFSILFPPAPPVPPPFPPFFPRFPEHQLTRLPNKGTRARYCSSRAGPTFAPARPSRPRFPRPLLRPLYSTTYPPAHWLHLDTQGSRNTPPCRF